MRKITIGTFDCTENDIKIVSDALRSGYLSTGKEMKFLEEQVALLHNKDFGVMVNSGQSALEAAIAYAKDQFGKNNLNIVCPTTTYAATLWAILREGCTPIFCDIDETYNLDYNQIADIKEDIDVLLPVDLCGKTAEPPFDVWNSHYIIEDACEAFGNGNCGYGDITCFSFYVSHIITTGSGGMICVEKEEIQEWLRSFISHGRSYGGDFTKYKDVWVDRFLFDKVGVSYRSDNLSAALGKSQLATLDDVIKKRKRNAKILIDRYNKSDSLQQYFIFQTEEYHSDCVFQFFPILIRESSLNREHLLSYLFKEGIDSRVLLSLTNQPKFIDLFGDIRERYPNSNYCNDNGFIVGCHQNLDEDDMEYVIEILERYVDSNRRP